ncbi:MAG TPA: class I adenylate-forming enzyme family protein [Conexibacter sp.]
MRTFDDEVIRAYTEAGYWSPETIAQRVHALSLSKPDGAAFVTEESRATWRAYDEESTRLAAMLVAAGLAPDDRVGVLMPDGPGVHAAYLAAEKAGLTVVGIGPRSRANEIEHLLTTTGCSALVTEPTHRGKPARDLIEALRGRGHTIDTHLTVTADAVGRLAVSRDGEPVADADLDALEGRALGPDDLWLVNSTSGTTGLPKCVMQTQNRWKYFHQVAEQAGELTADEIVISLIPAPFGFGLWTAHFTPTLLGAPTIVQRDFDVGRACALIERERATMIACVSTQFIMMLNDPELERHDLSSLRVMFTGGERVPYNRAREFEERTGCSVLQFYGSNESGAVSVTTTTDTPERRLRTAGRLIGPMNGRVVDLETGADLTGTGERGLCLARGPAATPGYYADAAANERLFTPEGEMRSSDIVTVDAEGYLCVVGRDSDIVIRGGQNISAAAVEELVGAHPRVALVGVVGAPDEVFGERVCAFVVTRDGTPLEREELAAFLDETGASKYLWPEHVVHVDELPRATGGKVDKSELRRRIREGAPLDIRA